ncbi:hypothetical protein [Desertivirga arenae]|uniref:hypothetical protein n=1 Tax=Desertivirga arenae TaxID=2810309 RepID=UPI001A957B36|nr:hypothetical protein [Pedobacter sp. SYSU D00823]
MDNLPENGNFVDTILSDLEAEQYVKAFWREPTDEELKELALHMATDYVKGMSNYMEPEMDDVEKILMLEEQKQKNLKELKVLTRVMEMPGVNAIVFYTLAFCFSRTRKDNKIWFGDGFIRYIKRDGVLWWHDEEKDVLFEF